MSGKGSGRRPAQVPEKQQEDNWERIFGKKSSNGIKCPDVIKFVDDEFEITTLKHNPLFLKKLFNT
jgi:hypothetical protein